MIKVLIADDHAVVREGLKLILSGNPAIEIVGEAENGDQVLKMIRDEDVWDVLLLDIAMPGKHVLELIKLDKQQYPKRAILILSMYQEDQYAIRMLRSGADGYITKAAAAKQLSMAIDKLANGGKYITDIVAQKLLTELNPDNEKPLLNCLTDREFQVFYALGTGRSMADIANSMALSVKTVSTYQTRIMKKMNMSKNTQIIHYALSNYLYGSASEQFNNIGAASQKTVS
jgi:two-component system, NarL family, invasion response regulator UvrY